MSDPVAFPIATCAGVGVTYARRVDEYLFVGRGTKVEVYEVLDGGKVLVFVTSHVFRSKALYVGRYREHLVVGFADHVLVTDWLLREERLYEVLPGEERASDSRVQEYCGCGEVVVGFTSRNTLCFVHLGQQKSESVFFKAGRILSLAAHGDHVAVLASTQYLDPGNVFHNFKSLRSNYLAVFQVYGTRVAEVQKTSQLPFDSYKVVEAPQGFLVLAPRQLIFKRFKTADLRVRFSYLYEETDADGEALREFFKVFGQPINFDFSNILRNKVYNYLNDNVQKEDELIQTVDQPGLLKPLIQMMPGTPAPGHQDELRYYGYDRREINIKYSQIINVLGDFPTFDYTLEAELTEPQNIKYIGPRCGLQQFDQIPPLYHATVCFLSGTNQTQDENLIIFSQYGLQYSLQFTAQGVQMTPVLQADPDLSLWTQQQITCAEALGSDANVQDFFDQDDTASHAFNLFLGSAINDSYVMQFQLSSQVPSLNFYHDYREKAGFGADERFRKQLYEELQNACRLINVQKERIQQSTQKEDALVQDNFAGVQISYRQSQFDALFNYKPKAFAPSNLLSAAGHGGAERAYDSAEHFNSKAVTVLPSLAGVVDLTMAYKKHAGYIQNWAVQLHYAGVIERIQTQLQMEAPKPILQKTRENPTAVFGLYREKDVALAVIARKQSAELLKLNAKTGENLQVDQPEFPASCVLMAAYSNGGLQVAAVDGLYYYPGMRRNPQKITLQAPAISADKCEDNWLVCHNGGISLASCSQQPGMQVLQYVKTEDLFAEMPGISRELRSATLIKESASLEEKLLGFQTERDSSNFTYYAFLVTERSQLVLLGMESPSSKPEVLGALSLLEQTRVRNFVVPESPADLMDDHQEIQPADEEMLPLFISQVRLFVSNGMGTYLVCSTRGGAFLIYQALRINGMHRLKLIKEPFGPALLQVKGKEDWFGTIVRAGDESWVLQGCPIQAITLQNDVAGLFLGYPNQTNDTEPGAFVVAPTIQGAISIYAMGRRPSIVKAGNSQKMLLQTTMPPRYLIQLPGGETLCIVDYETMTPKDMSIEPASIGQLFLCKEISLGSVKGALENIPLSKTQANFPAMPQALYLASFAQNGSNLHRQMLHLPFTASKITFHSVSNSFLVVSSVPRYEVRPTHSITRDEVANIRLFQMVEANETTMEREDLIKLCRMIKPRDPAPFNTHSVLVHEHLWLIDQNQILDHQPVDLPRTEHVCSLGAEIMHSRFPGFYGKLWEGSYQPEDEFGRQDRRKKNDEAEKRQEILQQYKTVEESRELVLLGTGYLMGAFNKEYGKIYLFTVEQISGEYKDQLQKQLKELSPDKQQQFAQIDRTRVAHGEARLALNKVTSHEIQNAATQIVSFPNAQCILVAEAKQLIGYLLVDGQKLEKCHQTPGFGFVSEMKRFQDFLFIGDAFHDSKLWVFRSKGRRLTEFAALSRQLRPVCSEFFVSQYTQQMLLTSSIGTQRPTIGMYFYKSEAVQLAGHERLRIAQLIDMGGMSPIKIVKQPTAVPMPDTDNSGVSNLLVTAEGALVSLTPVPAELLALMEQDKAVMPVRNLLVFFDRNQLLGKTVTGAFQHIGEADLVRIKARIEMTRPAW